MVYKERADMIERRKLDVLCVQETRWKGRVEFKLFNHGVAWESNGVRVILKRKSMWIALWRWNRVSDRSWKSKAGCWMWFQCACPTGWISEEREEFWRKLDDVVDSVPRGVSGDWRRLQWIYRWKGNRSDEFWVGVVLEGGMQKVKWWWIFTIFT